MHITDAERTLLRDILGHYHDELRAEINRTDTLGYKEALRERLGLLQSLIGKIEKDGAPGINVRMDFTGREQPRRGDEPLAFHKGEPGSLT